MAASRKLKTIAGRLVRDAERKFDKNQKEKYSELFKIFHKILNQQKTDKNKIYSIHESAVSCIAKGKEAKKFEFGNKSGIVLTKKGKIIVGAIAFENNPYDGHTLSEHLSQTERLTGHRPKIGIVDRGYKGRKNIDGTEIISPKPLGKKASNYLKRKARERFKARAGIEPIIGHIKHDHRMLRNYLKGTSGDKFNTLLAAAAFNFKKKLNRIKVELLYIFIFNLEIIFSTKYFSLNNIRKKGLFQG
jgi:IS5 family transposase